jgi:hypothetical protein
MQSTATTLEEARSETLWAGAVDAMLLHFGEIVGKERAKELVSHATVMAVPPDGEDPWPFATGLPLEDHLAVLVKRRYNNLRRRAEVRMRGGSYEVVLQSSPDSAPTPEQHAAQRDVKRKQVAAIRERFADDPDVIALFECLLRPGDDTRARCPVGNARDLAVTRLRRFVGQLEGRIEEAAPRPKLEVVR